MSSAGTVYRPNNFPPSLDLGNVIVETLFKDKTGNPVILPLQNDGQWTNARLCVHMGGRVQTIANLTFTLNTYFNSKVGFNSIPPIAGSTLIYSTGATTVNASKTNWQLDLSIFWDGDSNTICGTSTGQMGEYILGQNTLANSPAANPNLHNASNSFQNTFYGLIFSGLFSGASAGNHAYLDVCSLELL